MTHSLATLCGTVLLLALIVGWTDRFKPLRFSARMYLRKIKHRIALYLLGLPKDTKGVCLPGTIRIPPGSGPIDIQGFHFILTSNAPGIKINSAGTQIDLMGGAT